MAAIAAASALLAGCAAPPPAGVDPLGAAPADFSLSLTVLSDQPVADQAVHLRQGRYVLFPDGSLHHEMDPDRAHGADWLPPMTRILSRGEVARVWSLAQQIGFADPDAGLPPVNFRLVDPPADEVVYLAGFRAWDRRWHFVRRAAHDDPPDAAMVQLVRHMADLAWAGDVPPAEVQVAPKRYDFGDDPYAPYRKP